MCKAKWNGGNSFHIFLDIRFNVCWVLFALMKNTYLQAHWYFQCMPSSYFITKGGGPSFMLEWKDKCESVNISSR